MKQIKCTNCGSLELHEENVVLVCAYCQSRFAPEAGEFAAAGTMMDLASDIQVLLDKCRTDPKNLNRYINLILDIDPFNEDVQEFL